MSEKELMKVESEEESSFQEKLKELEETEECYVILDFSKNLKEKNQERENLQGVRKIKKVERGSIFPKTVCYNPRRNIFTQETALRKQI